MPIQFNCPSCQHVLTVGNQLAGKAGKCHKCGAKTPVPGETTEDAASEGKSKPSSAGSASKVKAGTRKPASAAPAGNLANVMDELTESDFNRQSPFKQVYSPPKPDTSGDARLRRVVEMEKKDKKGKGKQEAEFGWNVLMGVHNIFESLAAVALIAIVWGWGWPEWRSSYREYIPLIDWGGQYDQGRGLTVVGSLAFLMMICGVVMLIHHPWFYIVALASYVFFCELHIFNVIARLGDRNNSIIAGIWLVLALFLTSYFFRPSSRKDFKVKGWNFVLTGLIAGVLGGALVGGVLYASGAMYTSPESLLPVNPDVPVSEPSAAPAGQ
ncbi:MAG TPA: hypothetical protein DCF63_13240 [Planctomycetaceae bacterium]|nr:hypothetical protein [Planctomycetaceae bacterium]